MMGRVHKSVNSERCEIFVRMCVLLLRAHVVQLQALPFTLSIHNVRDIARLVTFRIHTASVRLQSYVVM
jgi:hypothetical protein